MKIEQKFICEFCNEKFNTKKACKEAEDNIKGGD